MSPDPDSAALKGKVAVVVGASRGIGRAYALTLGRAGATVVVVARTAQDTPDRQPDPSRWGAAYGQRQAEGLLPGSVHETAALIEAAGGDAIAVPCDIAREEEVEAMARKVLDVCGRVDVLVNNAAIYPRYPNFLEIPTAAWDEAMSVNVRGPFLCCRALVPGMIERRSGSIISITSEGGAVAPRPATGPAATPTRRRFTISQGLLLYFVSKAALDRLTTWLAAELAGYGIAVNMLSPGTVLTEGMRDAAPPGYGWNEDADGITWREPTPEYLGPPLVYLAQQTAASFSGRSVRTDQFGVTWP